MSGGTTSPSTPAPPAWSSTPSNLPGASNVFDFVIAVTQDGVNANLDLLFSEGLASSGDVTQIIYIYNEWGGVAPISLAGLMAQMNSVNPFNVPQGTALTDPRIKALVSASFAFAIQVKIGIPRVSSTVTLPGWVDLSSDNPSQVTFNMKCSTFQACKMVLGSRGPESWTNYSQNELQPVIFQATVSLNFTSVNMTYQNLPSNVQQMILNIGTDAFSFQQLAFDPTAPGLMSTFELPGFEIKPEITPFYLDQIQALAAKLLLGVTVAPSSSTPWTLQPTSIGFEVDAYLNSDGSVSTDKKALGLSTLNFVCLTGGKSQPAPEHFKWNWISQSEESSFDGVVSINRDSLVAYFQNALLPFVTANCFNIHITVTVDSILSTNVTYSFPMTGGQTPIITQNKGGSDGVTALSFDRHSPSEFSSDQAGLNGDLGKMTMTQTYHMGVQFIGSTVVITQTQVVWTSISKNLTTDSGNIVDRTRVDTYDLGILEQGQLTAPTPTTTTINNDMNPSSNVFINWFTDINSIISKVEDYVRKLVSYNMTEIPLSIIQNFVFPGGKPFAFSSVAFATPSLDLVAKIKYVDPGSL